MYKYHAIYDTLGDATMLATTACLMVYFNFQKTTEGFSVRSQWLVALAFVTRYARLFILPINLYDVIMNSATTSIIILTMLTMIIMYPPSKDQQSKDTFRHFTLVLGATIGTVFVHDKDFNYANVLRAFANYVDALAMVPQIHLMSNYTNTSYANAYFYMCGILQCKVFYLLEHICRYYLLNSYNLIDVLPTIFQILLLLDCFWEGLARYLKKNPNDEQNEAIGKPQEDDSPPPYDAIIL